MRRTYLAAAGVACALGLGWTGAACAQDQYVGEIRLFGFNFCPSDWLPADGRILQINQYQALASLYYKSFGGDGQTTFGLPNLIGRAAVGVGSGSQPFATAYGASSTTLTVPQLPAHTHQMYASNAAVSTNTPAGGVLGNFPAGEHIFVPPPGAATVPMSPTAIGSTGSGAAVPTQSPALTLTYCVAVMGMYPMRP